MTTTKWRCIKCVAPCDLSVKSEGISDAPAVQCPIMHWMEAEWKFQWYRTTDNPYGNAS